MNRRREEFWCSTHGGGCGKYFLTFLRDDMDGDYTIECPNCKHHHFRHIKEGLVTDDRHSNRNGSATLIYGLKTTLKDTPWHDDPTFRRQQLRVYEGLR
jgi:phage FluMu protein Com